jgi:hypothetical protein
MKKLLYILLFVPLALFGQENYSLSFDGVDDYVEIPNFTFNDSIFSFSANVFFNEDQEWAHIFWIGDQIENVGDTAFSIILGINSHGIDGFPVGPKLYFSLNYGNGEAYSVDYNLNEWNAISGVFNGQQGVIKLYVNGSESVSSTDVSYLSIQNIDSFINTIGAGVAQGQPNSNNFNGQIDNFTVYNRELTTSEILDLNYSCPTYDGLVAFWDFNSPGDSLYDISGNENHGLIYGANTSPPSPFYNCTGCHDVAAINFQQWGVWDNYECIYSFEYLNSLQEEYSSYQDEATTSLSSIQQAIDTWNTAIDLAAGWNMFGYGCPEPIDVIEGLSNHTESIAIVKDNNGAVYLPEWDFNGIGDLIPGFGYQIKVTEAIEGFSLCDWYVNDIPEDNIVSLQDSIEILNSEIFDLECVNQGACSFNIELNECEFAQEGYDCSGEFILEIGDRAHGGIVFFIDETGEHGLIAMENDLTGFSWGCNAMDIPADSDSNGFENTSYMYQYCGEFQEPWGFPNIAYYLYNNSIDGYADWYIPSMDELFILYQNLVHIQWYQCSEEPYPSSAIMTNEYNFIHNSTNYGSSTESTIYYFKTRGFSNNSQGHTDKFNTSVHYRPIRSF